jgi:hypothetical protein
MRFFYLDAAIRMRHGHHGEVCRLITSEVRRRGVGLVTLGHQEVLAELRNELEVQPFFRWWTYQQEYRVQNPDSGWLQDFDVGWRLTLEDLRRIAPVGSDDIIYFHSVFPTQLMALLQWMNLLPKEARPRVYVEFGSEPGVVMTSTMPDDLQFRVIDPRLEPRGMLYHYVGSVAKPQDFPTVCLFTFNGIVSAIYETLIRWPVATLPWPFRSSTSNRGRSGKRPVRAAVVGHQRSDKGFQFIPDVLRQLQNVSNIEFLVHNSAPWEMVGPQNEVREIAAKIPWVIVDERPVDSLDWAQILDQTDLMICPYDPVRYANSHSGIVAECIANGIPCVVPARTVLSDLCHHFGGVAAEFPEWSASGVVMAIRTALSNFDTLAVRSNAAAQRWQQTEGAPHLVDRLVHAR